MKYLLFLLSFCVLIGCTERIINHVPTEVIQLFNNEPVQYVDIFKKTKTIFLETNSNCLVSQISQLDFFSDKIFILDKKTKNIFLFNKNGKFLIKIGSVGKGPGEFIRPTNFIINRTDSLLKVYDSAQKKILSYNFNGNFIKEIFIDKYLLSFGEWENGSGYWGHCPAFLEGKSEENKKRPIKFVNFNYEGREIKSFEGEKVPDELHLVDSYITSQYNDKVFFVEPFCDKISLFDGKNIDTNFKIDFSGKFLPNEFLLKLRKINSSRNPKDLNDLMNSYVFSFVRFFENDKWIYTFTPYHSTSTLYNKLTKKTLTFHQQPFRESGWETFFWPVLLKDDTIYSAANPSELFNLLKEDVSKKYSFERICSLKKMLLNVNEDDNPIIFIYEIDK